MLILLIALKMVIFCMQRNVTDYCSLDSRDSKSPDTILLIYCLCDYYNIADNAAICYTV